MNGRISNRYNLNIASVAFASPDSYCIVRALATPTCFPDALPLVAVVRPYNSNVLYGVVSPLIEVISGVPKTFVILTKLPVSKTEMPALTVCTSLGLIISLYVVAIFSISKPFT
mgnify:CR=1 FL=1